jgi:hypothetical protein
MANAQTGLFATEILIGLVAIGYVIYNLETAKGSIGDFHPIDDATQAYRDHQARSTLANGPPTANWNQDDIRDYDAAVAYILDPNNKPRFTAAEIAKAQQWRDYVTANPSAEQTPAYREEIQRNINILRGEYPLYDFARSSGEIPHNYFRETARDAANHLNDYPADVQQRITAWNAWEQYPAGRKPTDLQVYRDAHSAVVRAHYPTNDHTWIDSYTRAFDKATKYVMVAPLDYPEDVVNRASAWTDWINDENSHPMPSDNITYQAPPGERPQPPLSSSQNGNSQPTNQPPAYNTAPNNTAASNVATNTYIVEHPSEYDLATVRRASHEVLANRSQYDATAIQYATAHVAREAAEQQGQGGGDHRGW